MIFKNIFYINQLFKSIHKYSSSVLNKITKFKENIQQKLSRLINDEANVQPVLKLTFKPVIDPLTEISNKHTKNFNTNDPIIEKKYIRDK